MSRYENYEIKNNVFGTLSAPISSLATTIQLGDGQGQRFSENMLATLENIENGKVMKREIVLITAINGDVLTVERKYAPCPANDDANTQGKVSYAFSTDDTISAYIDKEHFDEIDKSINDIYDNGVNKLRTEVISGLQVKVNAGPVLVGSAYYDFAGGTLTLTDNATNYIEIDKDGNLGSSTTGRDDKSTKLSVVTTSGGAITSIEDWRLGTVGGEIGGVNIHELTEKTNPVGDDEFVIADSDNIYNNKKVKLEEFQSCLSYTDKYAFAGESLSVGDVLDTKKIFSPDSIRNGYFMQFNTTTSAIAIKQTSIGKTINSLGIFLRAQFTSNTATGITLTIEGDNNGEPNGNPIITQDITNDIKTKVSGKLSNSTLVDGQDIMGLYNTAFSIRDIAPDDKHVFIYHNGSSGIYETTDTNMYRSFSLCGSTVTDNANVQLINKNFVMMWSTLYKMSTDWDWSSKTAYSGVFGMPITGTSVRMSVISLDGKMFYRLSYTDNTVYIDVYELNTPRNLNGGTKKATKTVSNRGGKASGSTLQYRNGFLFLSAPNRSDTRYMYSGIFMITNDSNYLSNFIDTTISGPAQTTVNTAIVNYNFTREVMTLGGGGNGYQLYVYSITPTYIYEVFPKATTINLTTPVNFTVGTNYRVKIAIAGITTTNNYFTYGVIQKDTKYTIKKYTNSAREIYGGYAYLDNEDSDVLFYRKADTNTLSDIFTPKINRKSCNTFDRVLCDIGGISKKFTSLVPGEKYYLDTENPGKVTRTVGDTLIGTAIDTTDIYLGV